MQIHEEQHNGVLVLRIDSQIDSVTGPNLEERLDVLISQGQSHLVLDLSKVPYISSAGLRVLSVGLKAIRASEKGGELCLANMSDTVAHAFRISGFNQVFSIYDTVAEALAALAAS